MAEFLVTTADGNLRQAGDIVAVRPDGWEWGSAEDMRRFVALGGLPQNFPNEFGIVAVPRYPDDRNLASPLQVVDTTASEKPTITAAVSSWQVDIAGLFTATDRYAELTVGQARSRIRHKGDPARQLPVVLDDISQAKIRNAASTRVLSAVEADQLSASVDLRRRRG